MRLLLDTHAYLWWLTDDRRLGKTARDAVSRPHSVVHISAASIWEIGIKVALGRLAVGSLDVVVAIRESAFEELAVTARHAHAAAALPRHHDDPFDRMLIAQARVAGATLLTVDPAFARYSVPTLW